MAKAANGGRPVDIVLDPGSGIAKLPVNLALPKGASLIGVDVRQFGEYEPDVQAANM